MLCIPIVGPTFDEISLQISQAIESVQTRPLLLEFRFDLFSHYTINDLKIVRDRLKNLHIPIIFTLRKKTQGGFYKASEVERLQDIRRLSTLNPDYFDLEYDLPLSFIEEIKLTFKAMQLIISYHDFSLTPLSLEDILRTMQKLPGDLYKMACYAHTTNDSLRMLKLIRDNKPLLGMCMGEKGALTRILGPMMGAPWTFACLSDAHKTADGQMTASELTSLYHIQNLGPKSALYGLIGATVTKSMSHLTHNRTMHKCQIDGVYVKMAVEKDELQEFFSLVKDLPFQGLSVTMPLKEDVIGFLSKIDEKAQKIGAVNTIVIKDSEMIGYNTDAEGALDAIENKCLDYSVEGKKLVIIGAGGAARAIAFEALKRKAHVLIMNRTKEKAEKVGRALGIPGKGLEEIPSQYDILINTTPSAMPIKPHAICPHSIVMDINSVPKMSQLLSLSQEKGCTLVFGYEMFLNQAIAQFRIWGQGSPLLATSFQEQSALFK